MQLRTVAAHLAGLATGVASRAHLLPVLLGLAIGWQWHGAGRVLARAMEPSHWAVSTCGIVLLLSLAIGPHLPEWLAGITRRGWRRRAGIETPAAPERESDRAQVTAVFCGVAGVLCLLQLALAGPALRLHEWLLEHFFWTPLTLVLLNTTGLAILLGAGWAMQGLIIMLLTTSRGGQQAGAAASWSPAGQTLLGFAAATATASWWLSEGLSGHQLYLAGVLPLFLMAALSAGFPPPERPAGEPPVAPDAELADAPDVAGADAWLAVAALLTWPMAAVFIAQGFIRPPTTQHGGVAAFLLGISVGALGRFRRRSGQVASLSDAGLLLWLCGLVSAAAFRFELATGWTYAALATAGLMLGHALHRLEQACVARLGRERIACAQLVTTACAGAAVGLAVAHWWVLPGLGTTGLLTVGVLSLFGTAGILQIYTQDRPAHVRHARLGMVFTTLALAILVFPGQAREALRRQMALTAQAPADPVDPWLAEIYRRSQDVCWLSPSQPKLAPHTASRTVFLSTSGWTPRSYPAAGAFNLLTSHRHFELLYQYWPDGGEHFPQYAFEWFQRLVRASGHDGLVVIDVPRSSVPEDAQEVIAATFARACGGRAALAQLPAPGGGILRLISRTPPPDAARMTHPARIVESSSLPAAVHSLSRDGIRPAYRKSPPRE